MDLGPPPGPGVTDVVLQPVVDEVPALSVNVRQRYVVRAEDGFLQGFQGVVDIVGRN